MKLSSWCLLVRSFVRYFLRKRNSISGQNAFQWCTNCIKVGSPPKHRWRNNCLHLELYPNNFASILLKYPDNGTKMQIKKRIFRAHLLCVYWAYEKCENIDANRFHHARNLQRMCSAASRWTQWKSSSKKVDFFSVIFVCVCFYATFLVIWRWEIFMRQSSTKK